ncbi:MAG: hypothetical protein HYZ11_15145 [Candidatus Tectomicrobia bacterium]|uniref:Flagellin N-terminal domain-containing protein n=1 Tax=Tectimicrobiota bacterium TaxID=2528274 RepID=A0A932I053_UNCTE|nr:hypothetical protein [Candidatus Tectomicrobia bacterium]
MVARVTAAQRFSVALRNILTSLDRVQRVQEQIVTGKQLLRPSDDPAGFSKVTSLRALISDSVQFRKNIDASKGALNVTDQTLASIRSLVGEARTLAIGQAGAPADATTRAATAAQVARIRDSILELANTQVGGRFIFAGTAVTTRPFTADGAYLGNDAALLINLGIANPSALNVAGTEFLTTGLNPDLYRISALSKSTAAVSDRYLIDTAGADANNAIAVKSSPSGTVIPVTFAADMGAPAAGLGAVDLNVAGGGLTVGREYAYVVSAVDSTGESIHSAPVTRPVGAGNNAVNFSFDRVAGAVSYRIYRLDDTEYAATGAAGLEGTDFEQQDSLIGTVFDQGPSGPASYTFTDTGQAQQAGQRALGTSSASRTFSGTQLASLVQLRVNNSLKEVTNATRTIRIVEGNGLRSADITVATGLKTGLALASELQTAINASAALSGSTAGGGAGYTVAYDPFADKFTITAGSPVTEMQVDTAQGGLAGLMGFTASGAAAASVTSDATATGVKVAYDTAKDIFSFRASGTAPDKIQVLSAATNPLSTAAGILGFTVDSAQAAEVTSNVKTAFNIISGTNDTFSAQVDGGTNTSITILANMAAPASGLATAELNSPGGSLVVGRQYAYAVSAVDVTGESIHSAPVTRTVTAGNNAINFTFDRVPGAVSYRIYRLDDTEYAATGAAGLEGTDFEQQDSLIGTVNDLGNAGPASYTFLDTGQAQQAGQRALGTATGKKVFTGEDLAGILELRVNNQIKQVAAGATSIRILEDGGVRSATVSIAAGTKSGFALATELQAAINASTVLTGSTSATPPGAGYTVTYNAVADKFSIQVGSPGANVGVDIAQGGLAALMGFTAASPFAATVTSDAARTGAKVDFNVSFKDSFTVSSPALGAASSITLAAGGTDILGTLNLAAGAGAAADSTRLADLNGGRGVAAGSISITNRAGQTFTVDLSTAVTVDDVFTKIEATATGVKASVSADGKRIVLKDTNSPQVSNLIVREVGTSTTASDLGIKADVPGDIVGLDVDPAVSSRTLVSATRDGAGILLGTVDVGGAEVNLALGGKITVADLLSAINTGAAGTAEASISADGQHLRFRSLDSSKSALITDVSGRSAQELGFQGANNLLGLLQTLEEALLRNDGETIARTLDVFTDGLERVGLAQVKVGQVTQQFDRFKAQQEEVQVSFTEVLSSVEDADIVEAMTRFSIFQNTLQAALASSAQILQVQLLDFLR